MKQSHPMFWVAGWGGVVAGALLAVFGLLASNELLNALGGYGLVVAGCGLYLVAGLKVREMVARRRTQIAQMPAAKQTVTQR